MADIRCVYCRELVRMDELEEHYLTCVERDQAYAQQEGRPGDEAELEALVERGLEVGEQDVEDEEGSW